MTKLLMVNFHESIKLRRWKKGEGRGEGTHFVPFWSFTSALFGISLTPPHDKALP